MAKIDAEPGPISQRTASNAGSERPDILHLAFECVPDAVLEVDAAGKIVFSNSRAEKLFGYRIGELRNQTVEILIPKDFQATHAEKRAAYSARAQIRDMGSSLDLSGLRKDGTRFAADISLNPIRLDNEAVAHTFAFIRDVTHLRQAEAAERELREQTLLGVVVALNSVMSLTSPFIVNRAHSIKALVSHVARRLRSAELWQYELAAALCLIGCITVPPPVFEKAWTGATLSPTEDRMFRAHPAIGAQLLSRIPRLERVAEIVEKQQQSVSPSGSGVEFGIYILQLAQHADQLLYQGTPLSKMRNQLHRRENAREDLLDALASYVPPRAAYQVKALPVAELQPGMILDEDIRTRSGVFIAPHHTELNAMLLERIRNFAHSSGINEPIEVRCPV